MDSEPRVAEPDSSNTPDNRGSLVAGSSKGAGSTLVAQPARHPAVAAWVQQENQKAILKQWFTDPANSDLTAADAWKLIERAEQGGRVMAFEALHLKMAWLERESDSPEHFEQRAAALLAQYRRQADEAAAAWAPETVPGFGDYKARERQIIDEVNALGSIPGGLSRPVYLRQRLLEARIDAYGRERVAKP